MVGPTAGASGDEPNRPRVEHVIVHFTFIDSGDAGVPWDSDPTDDFIVDIERDRFTCS